MKLYHLSRTDKYDYDEYSDDVVCARNVADAKALSNVGDYKDIIIECIGIASRKVKRGVVCRSFHAG